MMCLDECVAYPCEYEEAKAVRRTTEWAARCKKSHTGPENNYFWNNTRQIFNDLRKKALKKY